MDIKNRDARRLTIDEVRTIVRIANNTRESLNGPPCDLQAILDMHHAASDAGWDGSEAWRQYEYDAWLEAWKHVVNQAAARRCGG